MRSGCAIARASISLLVAAAVSVPTLSGCGWRPDRGAGSFTVLLETPPDTLDPRFALSAYSMKVCRLVHRSLTVIGPDLAPQNDLAASIAMPDPAMYVVTLKDGVMFHDGAPLTSDDVRYTYESILDPATGSPYQGYYARIKKIDTPDPRTVVFTLAGPDAPFVADLIMGIVPRSAARLPKGAFGRRPVGAGPFRFVSWETDELLMLARAGAQDAPSGVKTLVFKTLRDDNTRLLSLLTGDADLFQNAAPPLIVASLKGGRDVKVQNAPSILYTYLGVNMEDPLLKDVRVRRAIAHAIDRDAIIAHKFGGMARPATGLLAPEHPMYEGGVALYKYDPVGARRLLDEAGFPDPDGDGPRKRFGLTYKTSTNKFRLGVAKVIAGQLEAVGIGVKLRAYEFGTFFSDVKAGNFQLYSLQWTEPVEADSYRSIFHSRNVPGADPSSTGLNRGRYKNPALDELLDAGRAELDPERRKAIYSRVQKVLAEELPYISLYHEDNVAVMGKNVEGFTLRPHAGFEGLATVGKPR